MSRRKRGRATQSTKRRYGIWVLVIAMVVVLVAVNIIAFSVPRGDSPSIATIDLAEIPRISVAEVKAKLDGGSNMVIVDTRSREEYEGVRIPGAISIPVEEIAQSYSELSRYDEVVTYCT